MARLFLHLHCWRRTIFNKIIFLLIWCPVAQWVGQKGPEAAGSWFEHRLVLVLDIFLTFYTWKRYQKSSVQNWFFFVLRQHPHKSTKSRVREFESQCKTCLFCILNRKKMFLKFLYEFEEIIWLHDLLLLCIYDLLMVTRIIWWNDLLQIERYFIFMCYGKMMSYDSTLILKKYSNFCD